MAGRNRWTQNPEVSYDSGGVDPGPDDCCCSWLKPNSKPIDRSKKQNEKTQDTSREGKGKEDSNGGKKPDVRSDAPKVQHGQGTVDVPKGNSNKNTWSDNMQPHDSSGVSRDQRAIPKNYKYTENDPVEATKNGAVNEFKGKQVWSHDQENSDGIHGNQKFSSPGQDNKQEEIKKKSEYTNVTKSKDETQRSDVLNDEDNDSSRGGTRPDSTKNKGKGNNGNHGGTMSDPTKIITYEQAGQLKEKENDRIKNRYEDGLQDKPEGIHRDRGPDLTKKESSSSPEAAVGVQKREGKQKETKGINNNDEQFRDC